MKSVLKIALISALSFSIGLTGCHSESHDHQNHTDITANETFEPRSYEGTGTVISIPPSKRNLMVKHGDIAGFMNAMTMPMFVRDTSLIGNVAPGDSISFTIEEGETSIFITKIEVIE